MAALGRPVAWTLAARGRPAACYRSRVTWIAGVDGCRGGWFRACRHTTTGELRFGVLPSITDVLERTPKPCRVAIDIPIGLPTAGPRDCDRAARARLGSRRSSVFPAPVRATLVARTHAEASRLSAAQDGRRMSAQAFHLLPKIREVDAVLAARPALVRVLSEVHPELSFATWNAGTPMAHPKRSPAGRAERLGLAEHWLGEGVLAAARGDARRNVVADDDILDAIATLWTAHRILEGEAETLPSSPPRDEAGLPMRIVC